MLLEELAKVPGSIKTRLCSPFVDKGTGEGGSERGIRFCGIDRGENPSAINYLNLPGERLLLRAHVNDLFLKRAMTRRSEIIVTVFLGITRSPSFSKLTSLIRGGWERRNNAHAPVLGKATVSRFSETGFRKISPRFPRERGKGITRDKINKAISNRYARIRMATSNCTNPISLVINATEHDAPSPLYEPPPRWKEYRDSPPPPRPINSFITALLLRKSPPKDNYLSGNFTAVQLRSG